VERHGVAYWEKRISVERSKEANGYGSVIDKWKDICTGRYVAEAFGATVRWKDEIKTVYIDTNKTGKVEVEGDTREVAGLLYERY